MRKKLTWKIINHSIYFWAALITFWVWIFLTDEINAKLHNRIGYKVDHTTYIKILFALGLWSIYRLVKTSKKNGIQITFKLVFYYAIKMYIVAAIFTTIASVLESTRFYMPIIRILPLDILEKIVLQE